MATRSKPKEIVIESQKIFGVVAKILNWIAIPLAVITVVVVTIWSISDYRNEEAVKVTSQQPPSARVGQEIPLASSPQSSWPKLVIPAGEKKSERVTVPPSMRTTMIGDKFRLLIIYQSGRECVIPDQTCPAEPQAAVHALNDSRETNIVSYAFVPD